MLASLTGLVSGVKADQEVSQALVQSSRLQIIKFDSSMKLWGNLHDQLIEVLKNLVQSAESGLFKGSATTRAAPAITSSHELSKDLRLTIEVLRRWRKEASSSKEEDEHVLFESLASFTEELHKAVEQELSFLPSFQKTNQAGRSVSVESLSEKIQKNLEDIREYCNDRKNSVVTSIALAIQEACDVLEEKTHISKWGVWAPAMVSMAFRWLPNPLYKWVEQHMYGGAMPGWELASAGFMPYLRIVPPAEGQFRGLARVESRYSQIISAYFMWDYLRQTGAFDGVSEVAFELAGDLKNKMTDAWSTITGKSRPQDPNQFEIVTNSDLDDENLIGLEAQKEQLMDVVEYMLDPEEYARRGKVIQKGILLTGPSRTGKTLIARALVGTLNKLFKKLGKDKNVSFIEANMSEMLAPEQPRKDSGRINIVDMFGHNKKEDFFRRFIERAMQHEPCVVFLDELHMYQLQTIGNVKLLGDFLTVLNDLFSDPESQIIIIGATNRPDLLAKELLAHQRFGKEIRFNLPHAEQRKAFFTTKLIKQLMLDPEELDIDCYVRQTAGSNYGQLQAVVHMAQLRSSLDSLIKDGENKQSSIITHAHIQQALDHEMHRFVNHNQLAPVENAVVAAHQAGHALAHMLLKPTARLEFVTTRGYYKPIVEVFESQKTKDAYKSDDQFAMEYGKVVTSHPHELLKIDRATETEKYVQIILAGSIAESLLLGSSSDYHAYDTADAWKALYKTDPDFSYQCVQASGATQGNEAACSTMRAALAQRMAGLRIKTHELLQANKTALEMLAQKLQTQGTLFAAGIEALLSAESGFPAPILDRQPNQ